MTLRRTGFMSRSSFGRRPAAAAPAQDRDERLAQRAARALDSARATAGMSCASTMAASPATNCQPIHKEEAQRSEAYRRAVTELPCMWCGISGFSQHAHLNRGKGFALKTDDRTGFPLCCARPGIEGCHAAYDQYRLVDGGNEAHHEYGLAWGRITRHTILEKGQWPQRLPLWDENA